MSLISRLKRRFFSAMDRAHLRRLARLDSPRAGKLARVVSQLSDRDPSSEFDLVARIEDQRRQWLGSEAPLVDGSLGDGREWDREVSVHEACKASKDSVPASLLFLLVEEFRPRRVLELGTNVGISAGYLAVALDRTEDGGTLYTLEASPYRLRMARALHADLGLGNVKYREGLFEETLERTLHEMESVDMAFVDGHHRLEPTLRYFDLICPHLTPSGIVVFDDIRLSSEMHQAWRHIQRDRRVAIAVDLYAIGVCLMAGEGRPTRRLVTPPISFALQHRELSLREIPGQFFAR